MAKKKVKEITDITPEPLYDIPKLLETYKVSFEKFIEEIKVMRTSEKKDLRFYDSSYQDEEKFIKVENYLRNTVIPHKLAVLEAGLEMLNSDWFKNYEQFRATFEQLLVEHDKSKFTALEAIGYANHDFKSGEPDNLFERAWHHHKMNNAHHPEYWINPNKKGDCNPLAIPIVYLLEMVADWVGAGKVYGNPIKEWLPKNLPNFLFNEKTIPELQNILKFMGIETKVISDNLFITVA